MYWISYLKLLLGLFGLIVIFSADICQAKACLGTANGLSHQSTAEKRLHTYRSMYTNCTYVEGNLELIFLTDPEADLSFLKDIEEVFGYVLIFNVYVEHIPLSSMRIIRGTNLFEFERDDKGFSLYVALNYDPQHEGIGLKQLDFVSLNEILAGSVFLFNNNQLCFENTIHWDDILSGEGADFSHHQDSKDPHRQCGECDSACYQNKTGMSHCWGESASECQRLNRVICSPQCDGRCYGVTPQDCCHKECAGGCDGPLPTQCWACLHFDNAGKCEGHCPLEMIYNPKTFLTEPNPDVKYAYGSKCVDECPAHLVQNQGACIQDCGHGMMVKDKKCVQCDGPCPKTCRVSSSERIHANNIHLYGHCTIIQGSIIVLDVSFTGDPRYNISEMHPSELSVLESVQEVTGYVKIQGQHDDFKDLSFLRNLKLINGRQLEENKASLHVVRTSLESLNLQSLEAIKNGRVLFMGNSHLCYPPLINWTSILAPGFIALLLDNGEDAWCKKNEQQCDPQCTSDGCWGQGDTNCLHCANFHLKKEVCLQDCSSGPENNLYRAPERECKLCDPECREGCIGAGAGNCTKCKHVKDGPFCKRKCPESKYPDSNGVCQSCHPNCDKNCTGPRNILGEGGCNACSLAILDEDGNVTECLPKDGYCPDGLYIIPATSGPMVHKMVCKACNEECKTCTGFSTSTAYCQECVNYEEEYKCVSNCSAHYYADNVHSKCLACDVSCTQCHGPTVADCVDCQYYKLYWDVLHRDRNPRFNCSETCPENFPVKLPDFGESKETLCVTSAHHRVLTGKMNIKLIVGLVVGLICVLTVSAIVFGYFWKQRSKSEENKLRLTARMSGLEESEPLTPTDAKPDMATLRLIKESELRRGNIIGSGAFGTVYKGFWIPEGETVKIPVAIKVLQEGTSPSLNKELLEEARIMASVYHPCCIRILAVCMTTQMMLVTQLMPLGCLLEYVRKNKMNIGSKVLLNWCTQIAKGMSYLEERQIVHRDLAARNVLVQSPGQVKITDFGLAKLLDYNEEEFHASGGKMPIKWLALECIQHRIFTHKSDVWSFGVTIWELFTYGQRPYESVRARDIPDLLEKGERLPQPSICTIDVYMIMIKCWMLDADSRPSFKELADEFAKMARDPGRYLVIQGDRLMRLPSHNQDAKDILRNMSIASDTPEDFRIMEADDYLQPRGSTLEPPQTPPSHVNMNGKLERIREDSKDSSTYDDRLNNTTNTSLSTSAGSREGSRERDYPAMACGRREKKYSGLEAAAAARRQRETAPNGRDSLNSRYCSDPCKVPPEHWDKDLDGEFPDMPAPPTPIEAKPPGDLDIRLPIDEDDYLQPKSSNPRAYMDLVDGPDYLASDENSNPTTSDSGYASKQDPIPPPSHYLDMSSPVRTAIDNPEYFDRTDGDSVFPSININGLKNDKQPPRLQSVDSDLPPPPNHDYYNDFSVAPKPSTMAPSVYIDPRSESRV